MEEINYRLVETPDELANACERLARHPEVGFDTETTSLSPFEGRVRLVQLAAPGEPVYVIDLDRFTGDGDNAARRERARNSEALAPLRRLLAATRPVKIGHNLKFDGKWVQYYLGVELCGEFDSGAENKNEVERGGLFDTLLASQLISAGEQEDRHSLASVSERYLNLSVDKTQQVSDWGGALSAAQLEYAARDAGLMLPLRLKLVEALRANALTRTAQLEFECVVPLASLELAGVHLEQDCWRAKLKEIAKRRDELHELLQDELAEEPAQQSLFGPARANINLDSHVQLTRALKRVLPAGEEIPDSTRNWKLEPLAVKYAVVRNILDYRTLQKTLKFGETLLDSINKETGRIHSHFHQIGAPTGRMSCLAGDTLVSTDEGLKPIREIKEGDRVKTSYGFKRVEAAWSNGLRRLYRVLLKDGRTIRATSDHKFLTGRADTWKRLDELSTGDTLYISLGPSGLPGEPKPFPINLSTPDARARKLVRLPESLSVELCELMGLIIADGFLGRRHVRPASHKRWGAPSATYDRVCLAFNRGDTDLIEKVVSYGVELFGQPFVPFKSKTCYALQLASTKVAEFLAALGLSGKAHTKFVPEIILSAPPVYRAAFLRGLFEGDGNRSDNSVGLTSVNRRLLSRVQLMLSEFGIYSVVRRRNDTSGFSGSPRFDLKIHRKADIETFFRHVGFISRRKNRPYDFASKTSDGIPTPFVVAGSLLYREAVAAGTTTASRAGLAPFTQFYKGGRIKGESVRKLIDRFGMLPSLRAVVEYLDLQLRPVPIASIELDGVEEVYDLTVEGVHEFIAEGIVVHNCTDPNVQQVPHAFDMRRCFRAPAGRKLVDADYCVAAGTRVATSRGLMPVERVTPGDDVYLEDGSTARVSATVKRGMLPAVTVTLKNGYALTATTLHRIRVLDEEGEYVWRRIDDLKQGDRVAIQPGRGLNERLPYVELPAAVSEHHNNHKTLTTPRYANERLATFIGYVAGDGALRLRGVEWVVNAQDADVYDEVCGLALELFRIPVHDRGAYRGVHEAGLYSSPLLKWLTTVGLSKGGVPDFLWVSRPSVVAAYLRGLFESDGSVTDNDTGKVSFASSRRRIAAEVHMLLLALGIPATLREQRNTGPDKRFNCWCISVVAAGLRTFGERVGFMSRRKREKLHALLLRQTGKTVVGNMPNLGRKIRSLRLSGEARRLLNNSSSLGRPVSTALAATIENDFPEVAHSLGLQHVTKFKQLFLPVSKIEPAGEREVFDLSVPGPMTYISDGFVSHNSQIELRILADFTNDQGFVDAFRTGADLHRVTAAQVFNVKLEEVSKEQRDFAKRLNFGVVYGIGARRFALLTGLKETEAEDLLKRYFATYRGLDAWLRDAGLKAVRERTALRTVAGRLFRFNFDPEDRQATSLAQRNGKNAPIQGSSADIIKRALRLLHDRLKGTGARVVNVVHDEVVVECPEGGAEGFARVVEEAMCDAGEEYVKAVPVKVESAVTDEWVK